MFNGRSFTTQEQATIVCDAEPIIITALYGAVNVSVFITFANLSWIVVLVAGYFRDVADRPIAATAAEHTPSVTLASRWTRNKTAIYRVLQKTTAQSLQYHNFAIVSQRTTRFSPKCSEINWKHKKDRV